MITVKLYSAIRKYGGKEVMFEYVEGLTVRDIVEKLKIPLKEISIIILDHFDSTTDIMIDREVKESSLIHLFPPMAGG
ncbi:MAG: MoaD/ThiS family protein [Candidatus Izimaplasma sp.]|nr:MoaD/ThiS family protein [Candidatus Izimaplasma bacterium]